MRADDPGGVTAQFNRVLAVINRNSKRISTSMPSSTSPRWNSAEERIEMWLRADGRQRVRVGAWTAVDFDAGEGTTEVSCKFRPPAVGAELARPEDCIASDGGPMRPVTLACRWPPSEPRRRRCRTKR